MQKNSCPLPALALVALAACPAARAQNYVYQLHNVVFNDGGAATGYFVYNTQTNVLGAFDVTTTTGSTCTGFEYLVSNSGEQSEYLPQENRAVFFTNTFSRSLNVFFTTPLTGIGTFSVAPGVFYSPSSADGTAEVASYAREGLAGGYVTGTPAPEPSQSAGLALGALGLTGLGMKARKRVRQ